MKRLQTAQNVDELAQLNGTKRNLNRHDELEEAPSTMPYYQCCQHKSRRGDKHYFRLSFIIRKSNCVIRFNHGFNHDCV